MKKYTCSLPAKGYAWTMAMAIAFSSVPSIPAFAEEAGAYAETVPEEGGALSVFVVTEFPEYAKEEDGTYKDKEFAKTYKNLKAKPGTELESLGLPKSISLNGYWESEGPEAPTEMELSDLEWKLKSDSYELYSIDLPAGSYTFVPDLEAYTLPDEATGEVLFDEIRLSDGVTAPTMTVTLEDAEAESETQASSDPEVSPTDETQPQSDSEIPLTDGTQPQSDSEVPQADGTPIQSDSEIPPADEPSVPDNTQTPTDDGTIVTGPSDDDIISGTDDSLIGADGNVFIDGEPETQSSENNTEDPNAGIDTLELTDEDYDAMSPEDIPQIPNGDTPTDTPETTESETQTDTEKTTESDTSAEEASLNATLFVSSGELGTVQYQNAETNNVLTLKSNPAEGENTFTFEVPCNFLLDNLTFELRDTAAQAALPNITIEPSDTDTAAAETADTVKVFTVTDHTVPDAPVVYTMTLTVANAEHTLSEATCTAPATCSVCGTTVGEPAEHQLSAATCTSAPVCAICNQTIGTVLPHNYSVPATCLKKATCSMCGAEDPNGQLADHTSSGKATCADPEICTVCNQVITPALGHDWKNATCTLPKTCARCGATEGKPLGHDMQTDWIIEKESTDSEHGIDIRYCRREACDYSEQRPRNIIGTAERNSISGISEGANYNLKTAIPFTANGSGMANAKPINGDIRFVPSSWKVQNTPGEFKDNYSGAFSISIAGNYTLTVNFQKQIYQDDSWKNTDTVDSKSVTFSAGQLVQGTPVNGSENGIRINPQTGDNTVIIPLIILLVVALLAITGAVLYKKKRK